ncbi:conjugal transfer protein TrbL family protein [Streptosporangium soli]|nr:hypothetical protein [Streptosporangium sp. KLBMP 9127]
MPTPSPSPAEELSPPDSGFDIGLGGWITDQINSWFAELVARAIKPLLDVVAATLLATPSVAGQARIQDLWQVTAALANGAFAILVVAAGVLVMGYETVQTRYAFKEVAPRLVVAFMAANFSFFLVSQAIDLSNAISRALLGQGFDARRAANAIRFLIVPPANSEIFYILLALVAVILLVLLLITFVFRVAMTALLVIAAPLALACLALPQTNGLAMLWWRAFSGLLLIQVAQSLTLVTAVRIFFNQDGREAAGLFGTGQLYNLLLALCLLIILVRIPGWVSRAIFMQRGRGSAIGRIVKYAVVYKLTAPGLNALHLGRGGGRGSAATRAAASRALALAAGPAGTAAAGVATAATAARSGVATAATAARSGTGPTIHAPTFARRPAHSAGWGPAPVVHAPSGPALQARYRSTPRPQQPIPPSTPVYGYPREIFYAAGPAGLGQMQWLRGQDMTSPRAPRGAIEPPPISNRPVRPLIAPNAPIPGTPEWPENPGTPRRTPPPTPPRPTRGSRGGEQR